ncbi:MAG: PD40 domain-containing protein [Theionarchaea archaeon]|nr:PD40 domain-containing protein [Theionarchaea archaeon]
MDAKCRILLLICIILFLNGCIHPPGAERESIVQREDFISEHAVKMTPQTDLYPPILHAGEWEQPIPVEGPINTAGAEDSPFIYGDDFYFFFTPDPHVPVENQVLDGVTGIYVSHRGNGTWSNPERVFLEEMGKCSLDGCTFIRGDRMWFCSAREGYTGVHWFTAQFHDGRWTDWEEAPFPQGYEVGELHITSDGNSLYFHSSRSGGQGGLDIWISENENGKWQEPQPIGAINTADNEGWPYITPDGTELFFTRTYEGTPAIFRSMKMNGEWQEPELIISQFAGEPSLDRDRNVYFVHHFYRDSTMIEADIYVAYHKENAKAPFLPGISDLFVFIGLIGVPWELRIKEPEYHHHEKPKNDELDWKSPVNIPGHSV